MTNAEARFNKSHIRKVYACLAVTCHLHFWQNDRDFLRATVVTRGWNGYRNKSQHRKSTLEKKILPPFQQGFEPATFQSRVRRSNHWAIADPTVWRKKVWGFIRVCVCVSRGTATCAGSAGQRSARGDPWWSPTSLRGGNPAAGHNGFKSWLTSPYVTRSVTFNLKIKIN